MIIKEFVKVVEDISNDKIEKLRSLIDLHSQIIILGNGGSNSIASHISQDYTKQLHKKSFSFTDPSRLTCYINDYGMEAAYAKFLKEFCDEDTFVILISSSGNSENIIKCLEYCYQNKIEYALLTGFAEDNICRARFKEHSSLEYWVDSKNYGVVECAHQTFLHTVV